VLVKVRGGKNRKQGIFIHTGSSCAGFRTNPKAACFVDLHSESGSLRTSEYRIVGFTGGNDGNNTKCQKRCQEMHDGVGCFFAPGLCSCFVSG